MDSHYLVVGHWLIHGLYAKFLCGPVAAGVGLYLAQLGERSMHSKVLKSPSKALRPQRKK